MKRKKKMKKKIIIPNSQKLTYMDSTPTTDKKMVKSYQSGVRKVKDTRKRFKNHVVGH